MIGIGVIGCGKIAQVRHLPEYVANKQARILGVFDLDWNRALETAAKYKTKAYGSYEELLDNPDIDAVSVCTANVSHCEITVKALLAGKHVLCEKPMAVTLEECRKMAETAETANRYLMVGHNQRLAKAHMRAKQLIEQGEIGRILTFRTYFGHSGPETWAIDRKKIWFFDRKTAALGAMGDLGIHKTDLIQYLTGQYISEVSAFLGALDKKDENGDPVPVDDNAICIYRMENGITGTMTASWTNYGREDNSTILYGTEGVMYLYADPEYSLIVEKKDGSRTLYSLDRIQTNDSQTSSGIIELWMNCLTGHKEPEISGREALHAMEAVFAAVESAKTGKTIRIR